MVALIFHVSASGALAKATPPIALRFVHEGAGSAPHSARLALHCTPRITTERLRLAIRLPKGTRLVAGSLSWEGPLGAHKSRVLRLTVAFPPGLFGRVTATATMARPSRGRWVQAAEWAFNRGARKPAPGRLRGRARVGDGRRRKAGLLRPGGYREIAGAAQSRRPKNQER